MRHTKYMKYVYLLTFSLLLSLIPQTTARAADRVQTVGDQIVIVIDPGHGGSNLGTESGHTIEKEMTMVTAKAMKKELEQYDNVTVWLTHTDDRDMSLKERAEFAEEKGADFLFSIHYNASENHTMFGTEVWVSCEKPYNAYGYQFGYLHLQSMAEKGLFVRGVKNRKDDGKDYYGIIRESAARSVPAVIIEHCYVDEERDADYIRNEEDYAEFGRADALSVAKYFGLKSSLLGVDYSAEPAKLQPASADSLVQSTLTDNTSPDICEIELLECDYETGEVSLTVRAADYDSPLIYYDYSIDNGQSWTRLESWPGSDTLAWEYTDTFRLNLTVPAGVRPNIVLRAYNISDLCKKSNVLYFDQAIAKKAENAPEGGAVEGGNSDGQTSADTPATEPPEHPHKSVGTTTFMPVVTESGEEDSQVGILTFLKFCLVLVILLFIIVLIAQTVSYNKRRKRRQRR